MKAYRYLIPLLTLMALVMTGCVTSPTPVSSLKVHVPPAVPLEVKEIESLLPSIDKSTAPPDSTLDIVVLRYSPGVVTISYAGKDFTESIGPGYIRVLLKFREKGILVKTEVLEARGRSRQEILKKITSRISSMVQ